jgi:hypothetical protein
VGANLSVGQAVASLALVSGGESALRVIGLFILVMIASYIFFILHQDVRNQSLAGNVSYPLSLEALDCAVGRDFWFGNPFP